MNYEAELICHEAAWAVTRADHAITRARNVAYTLHDHWLPELTDGLREFVHGVRELADRLDQIIDSQPLVADTVRVRVVREGSGSSGIAPGLAKAHDLAPSRDGEGSVEARAGAGLPPVTSPGAATGGAR